MKHLSLLYGLIAVVSPVLSEDENYEKSFSECTNTVISIESIAVTCDSPGAYYYGGSNYRNSDACAGGDKGRVQISLLISESLEKDAYIDVSVKGYGTVSDATVRKGESLCSSVSPMSDTVCPEAGYYKLHDTFYWTEQSDSLEYTFSPKVTVGIKSSARGHSYDLAGANTDLCSGHTISNWSNGFRKSAADALKTFFVTVGILAGIIACLFTTGCLIRRQSQRTTHKQLLEDDQVIENEYQKMSMVGKNETLCEA